MIEGAGPVPEGEGHTEGVFSGNGKLKVWRTNTFALSTGVALPSAQFVIELRVPRRLFEMGKLVLSRVSSARVVGVIRPP
jgi:hypothetical protein